MTLKAIYLDMDGVLVDLVRHTYRTVIANPAEEDLVEKLYQETTTWDGIHKAIAKHLDPDFGEMDLYDVWAKGGQEFWASIPWSSHGKKLYEMCSRYAPVVLMTTPTIEPSCAAGKMEWIQRNLPKDGQRRYALSPCKHHMAHPGALLIDDGEHNFDRFREHNGEAFLWPGPWNETGKRGMTHDEALHRVNKKLIEMSGKVMR